jgi:tetratricopeptide (TPR) repeat protein
MAALRLAKQALDIDPQFKPALDLREEANKQAEEKIAKLMTMAGQLIAQEEFEKLRDLAQDILSIAPQNREVADLLREANAQILARNRVKNLELARKFYREGIYESALTRAEEVLKVEPDNSEAKELLEKSQAELGKPKLRVTGFTKIKGMEIAHIEIVEPREKLLVKKGDTFGDFKVSAVDFEMKVVIVTYTKTGSQQSLTTQVE